MIAPADGIARTPDGVELHYTLRGQGDATAPRYALVHSLALNRDIWTPVAERLVAGGAQVLTYDCRGHGASTRAPGPYRLEHFAADLAALLDALGWDSAIVAGASMGGNVAQAFAIGYRERVTALGLVDTTAWYGPDAPKLWRERAEQAREKGLQALIGFQLTRWFGDAFRAAHPEVLQHFTEVFLANDLDCYAASCEMLGSFDLRQRIAGLPIPTAIIVGEEDYATPPEMARQLHEAIPGSTLEILPAARHLTPLERPAEIAARLQSLANRRATPASDG
jgi:3-oxoadipate enol-lactonase